MTTMIERNTTIPARRSEIYSTVSDNQPAVTIHVLQGEEFAKDNVTLGEFTLVGIPATQEGFHKSKLHSILMQTESLTLVLKIWGPERSSRLKLNHKSLSEDEIQAKIAEAENFAEEDNKERLRLS